MLELRELRYILAIAKHQNITKAAEELYITQSALSKFLQKYEKDLGIILFQKLGNRFVLTDAGRRYTETAEEMLLLDRRFSRELMAIRDESVGQLNISFPTTRSTFILADVIMRFRNRYPGIYINVMDITVERTRPMVDNGEIDLAFVLLPNPDLKLLPYEIIARDEVLFVVSKTHPRIVSAHMNHEAVTLKMFSDEPFIMPNVKQRLFDFAVDIIRAYDFTPNIVINCRNHFVRLQLVEKGYGISPLYETIFNAMNPDERPAEIRVNYSGAKSEFAVAYYNKLYLPHYASYFIELVRTVMNQND